jgi:membrane protease YdiL (CAAX protease family)
MFGDQEEPKARSTAADPRWRAGHGIVVLTLLLVVPPLLGVKTWPFPLLVVLLIDALLILALPPMRWTLSWLQPGRLSATTAEATLAIVLVSSAGLILFSRFFPGETAEVAAQVPAWPFLPLAVNGIVFSLVNPFLEEILFRGILLDALDSQLGSRWAVAAGAGQPSAWSWRRSIPRCCAW